MRHYLLVARYTRRFSKDRPGEQLRRFWMIRLAGHGHGRHDATCGRRRDRLRRQALLPFAVSGLACRVVQSPRFGRLVALTSLAPVLTARPLSTTMAAIDMAAVATTADQRQKATKRTAEQPGQQFLRRMLVFTWTASLSFAKRSAHTWTTRCKRHGAELDSPKLRSAPCLPFLARLSPRHSALDALVMLQRHSAGLQRCCSLCG